MNLGDDERQVQAERLMIDEIKKRPYLWDESLPEHKDMEKVRAAWDNVGRMFAMSGAKVKSRWKSMRDIYVRYLRKLALKGGGSVPKWKHFEAMNFIADHIKHRRGDLQYTNFGGNVSGASAGQDGDKSAVAALSKYGLHHNSEDDDEERTIGSVNKRVVTRGRKRKRLVAAAATASAAVSSISNVLVRASQSTSTPNPGHHTYMISEGASVSGHHHHHQQQQHLGPHHKQQLTMIGTGLVPVSSANGNGGRGVSGGQETTFTAISIEDDADDLFGRAIAATLKKMPPRMKALSKLRIQQVLYELEEASSNTPPPNAVIYQATIGGPTNQQQQQQPPPGFM